MKLLLLRALATVGVVGLLCVGYVVVGILETNFVLRAERDVLATQKERLLALATVQAQTVLRTQAQLAEACRMLPFQTFDSCLATVDARLDRRARGNGR